MKKYLFSIIILTALKFESFCQNDSGAYLKGCNEENYEKYFDSIHQQKKASIQDLGHSYYFYVRLRIDSNYHIGDFEIIEMPEVPLPEVAKKYIKYLFFSTAGKWEESDFISDKNIAKNLFFSVSLFNKKETISESLKDSDKHLEFLLSYMPSIARLKDYDLTNERWLHLSF
ncbi:MAG: hypothetical protein H7Y86_13245 [Rhizobacter sp.]|nr:hypothetical protein [Ferruginibacter sp.]